MGIESLAQICAAVVNPINSAAMVLLVVGVIVFCIVEHRALHCMGEKLDADER